MSLYHLFLEMGNARDRHLSTEITLRKTLIFCGLQHIRSTQDENEFCFRMQYFVLYAEILF